MGKAPKTTRKVDPRLMRLAEQPSDKPAPKRKRAKKAEPKPKGATLRKMTAAEVAALSKGFGAVAAASAPARPARKQALPAVSSLASHVMRQPIDQKLWNSVRNDEQAFYALMIERQTLAACVLSNDETPGQA